MATGGSSQPKKATKAQKVSALKRNQRAKAATRLKGYREAYKQARAKGLVKDKGAPSKYIPTRYAKTRLNKLKPYLSEGYAVLKPSTKQERKTVREFKGSGQPVFNGVILFKREGGYEPTLSDGILKLVRRLDAGTFERIPLPQNVRTLANFERYVADNEYLDTVLKHSGERFNFRIFGNNSIFSFDDLESLFNYIDQNYDKDSWGDDWFVKQFELFRSYKDWKYENSPQYDREVERRKQFNANRRYSRLTPTQKENRAAMRMASLSYAHQLRVQKAKIKNETPEQREQRLSYKRARNKLRDRDYSHEHYSRVKYAKKKK